MGHTDFLISKDDPKKPLNKPRKKNFLAGEQEPGEEGRKSLNSNPTRYLKNAATKCRRVLRQGTKGLDKASDFKSRNLLKSHEDRVCRPLSLCGL
jgi:hypothetical protein